MSTITQNIRLGNVLFGETRRAVLSVMFLNPEQSFWLRQLARIVDTGQGAVQRELKHLTEAGIITRSQSGRQVFYQVNTDSPIYEDMRNIILKTSGLADVLHDSLQPLSGQIRVAFIYGSFASGQYAATSDVDVMVIGDMSFSDVVGALQQAQSKLNREINPTVYPTLEFVNRLNAGDHFIGSVVRSEKIFLIGDEDELAGLASK